MNSGRWLDSSLKNWQPSSCMMHRYDYKQSISCFAGRRIIFAGDSIARETYWALARGMDSQGQLPHPKDTEKHSDIHITLPENVRLDFFWDPYLNSTGITAAFRAPQEGLKPTMTIVSTGLWHAKNLGEESFKLWKSTIDEIALVSQGQYEGGSPADLIIILPILDPDYAHLSESRQTISPEEVSQMNDYLEHLSKQRYANVALAFKDMLNNIDPSITHDPDALHLVDAVTSIQAQVLTNLRCNDHLEKKFPFDKTCCTKYPSPNYIQFIFFAVALLVLPALYHLQHKGYNHSSIPTEGTVLALLTFGWILVYAYYTDRTHLFGKEHKHFSLEQFWFLVILTSIVGYFTSVTADKDQPFLNRDQTDEWKGWMQLLILIYHYLGASKISWIYNVIRVLVGMYLFMTGFGHTVFFYKKADYSFKRVVAVLIRLNLLNVVLAYTMNTDYLFYYFSPLVSFWFGVVWITMWIKHERNSDLRFLSTKIAISALITTIFTKTPGILETMFSVLRTFARINWDAVEWRFRVSLDMWIVYIGMIVAILFIKASDLQSSPHWPKARTVAVVISLITIPVFLLFEASLPSKFVYNKWHPYISSLPIIAFIVLRNASTKLRNTHSTAFAFIGRCSLETFILQFHIWLAGDTKGVLVVFGPSRWRWLSFILSSIIFIFISWKMASVTGTITEWIMGNQKTYVPVPSAPAPVASATERNTASEDEKVEGNGVNKEDLSTNEHAQLPVPVTSVRNLTFGEKLLRVIALLWEDLRVRTGAIIIGLWMLNLVPSSSLCH